MTDGESREPLPRPAGGEVRVPIAAPPRRPAEPPPEDAGSGTGGSPGRDPPPDLASEEEEQVPYPALAPTAFFCLKQTTRPRSWCLRLVCNPYPFPQGHRTPRPTGTPLTRDPRSAPEHPGGALCPGGSRLPPAHEHATKLPPEFPLSVLSRSPTSGRGIWGFVGVGQAGSTSSHARPSGLGRGDAHAKVPLAPSASSE